MVGYGPSTRASLDNGVWHRERLPWCWVPSPRTPSRWTTITRSSQWAKDALGPVGRRRDPAWASFSFPWP